MPFIVYIDESGDAGLTSVRRGKGVGASPYFVLGAAVFEPAGAIQAREIIANFKEKIGRTSWKHATDLKHTEKVLLGRMLGKLPTRLFAVISNKSTLNDYQTKIQSNPQKFYNKCVLYLLERITAYLQARVDSPDDVSVILEKRNHDYAKLIRYVEKVRENPQYPQSKALKVLNPSSISTRKKGEDTCLEVADFVAHAVYQCANKTQSNFFIPERRYFEEISSRFAGDDKGGILEAGLKCIHALGQLELDDDIVRLFESTRVHPPRNV